MTQPLRYYMQTISYLEFPDIKNFYSIPNELTGESATEYAIPNGITWYPAFIMASQDLLNGKKSEGMSIIGVYINGELLLVIPFKNDMHYILYEPLSFNGGITLELKLKPHKKNTRVCILIGGDNIKKEY